MLEIVWQYDPQEPALDARPATAVEAIQRLDSGNLAFSALLDPDGRPGSPNQRIIKISARELGLAGTPGESPSQEPFAAILGCADARVPLELIFGLKANDAFVVRVAGNVPGNESLGSLEYAVANLDSVRLLVVLGHTQCGAVSAAVDAVLKPGTYLEAAASRSLRSIIDSLLIPVTAAAAAMAAQHGPAVAGAAGYRTAVIEVAVALNAALTAMTLARTLAQDNPAVVVFSVYDLSRRRVGLPTLHDSEIWQGGLFAPPEDDAAFQKLEQHLAASKYITSLLS